MSLFCYRKLCIRALLIRATTCYGLQCVKFKIFGRVLDFDGFKLNARKDLTSPCSSGISNSCVYMQRSLIIFSNMTSIGNILNFDQVRDHVTLLPSLSFCL